ncbi:MAG: DUF2807 domain-containing protein [Bacteroidetes bacterium]|nr:DUF2807 domain-containing protein [Bacteroidota bacterium]
MSAILVVLLSGCLDEDYVVSNEGLNGSGNIVSQTRNVGTFDGIQVINFARIFITQDTLESLRVEADDNIIDNVITVVQDGILKVGLEDSSYNNITLNIHASMKNIKRLESRGAGYMLTTNSISADTIVCIIRGAGTMILKGTAVYESIEIEGAGSVSNFGLAVLNCSASISGAGWIEVNVSGQLNAKISGTGTIIYDGNPQSVNRVIAGVGSIQQKP